MAFISSYVQLNKKYDLNFSDNNYGFSWDIFKEFVGDEWAEFFTTNCFYRFVPTARLTRKTWNCLAFDLFICCNFSDSSVQEVRRYENTHNETTIGSLMDVCQYLADNYDIHLGVNNPHGIKWKITKDGGCIIFPNNQQIDFIGYANGNKIFGKAVGGSSYLCSRTDEIIMAEEKETLSEKQLTQRYERLKLSMFRSNRIKISNQPIKDWSWTFTDRNVFSPTYGQKITRYFYKNHFIAFTCNPYDKYHPFYLLYCTPYLPLNDKVTGTLKKIGKIYYEDIEAFSGLGLFILRFTLLSFWNKLEPVTKKLILELKKKNPDEFNTVYYGFEFLDSDATIFPFQKTLKYWQKYDLKEFYNQEKDMYKFDFYSVGIDWATGHKDHTVFMVVGFKEYNNTGYYDAYIICELVVTANDFINENEKISAYVNEILGLIDNFENFAKTVYFYDDKARTAIDWLNQKLIDEHNIILITQSAIKHASNLNQEAGLTNRVVWMRNIMSYGNFYANKDDLPKTTQCLEELRYDQTKTNIPDKNMYQDPYDALFYALYPYKNVIRGKNNGSVKKSIFTFAI
ncbi:MAG: hypothetical protein PPFGHCPK_01339 [Spiroplasma endosymbiont of Drosophila atripex]|nr:MAG: hypothetical protein PPFGHCPK_00017 [Spiroplasma endosymbiont of Drosophila atripex]WDA53884.1 MAG: hypothetical protein PPFGHCPK_00298 [Spiroplasma endosymbiont of Drosophila atripex]WDA54606.1 MAG: hypothetical protein PPFGHCPK_01062 [Spiroplasma endosymbiont of Drosophila atripex]WDA54858.1 MAG: hypothetical protein PPFGHCPK_01339 [Spiroplasma endosymbiont of Drosophila atripex]